MISTFTIPENYNDSQQQLQNNPPQENKFRLTCPRCGSHNVNLSAVAEQQKRGCLSVLLIIILLFIPIIGWIAIFMLLRGRKSETVTYAICQSCGNRWEVK